MAKTSYTQGATPMKKAFTMLELIIVMTVAAIIAMVLIPRFSDSRLREAADQILSHIRYTQHLAMIDDRFDPKDPNWHQERWQISFRQCNNNDWYYVVGRDMDQNGGVDKFGSAVNPSDGKKMFTTNQCNPQFDESDQILLSKKYLIDTIQFSDNCGNNRYIAFDNLGRPYRTTMGNDPLDLLTGDCKITFKSPDGNFTITVTQETGYARLSSLNHN